MMTWYSCREANGCRALVVRAVGFFHHGGRLWEVVIDSGTPYHVPDALRRRDRPLFKGLRWQDIDWVSMTGVRTKQKTEIVSLCALVPMSVGPALCDLWKLRERLVSRKRYADAAKVDVVERMAREEGLL